MRAPGIGTWSAALVGWVSVATAGVTAVTVLATTGNLPGLPTWAVQSSGTVSPKRTAAPVTPVPVPVPVVTPNPSLALTAVPVALVAAPVVIARPAAAVQVPRFAPRTVTPIPVDQGGLVAPVLYQSLPIAQSKTVRITVGVVTSGSPTVVVERNLPLNASADGGATKAANVVVGTTSTVDGDPTAQTANATDTWVGTAGAPAKTTPAMTPTSPELMLGVHVGGSSDSPLVVAPSATDAAGTWTPPAK